MTKGSPEEYNASETGSAQPAQKPQTGEPNERKPLYRIRCQKKKHQPLRKTRRRNHTRRGHTAGQARDPALLGEPTHRALARGDGSDAVQRLDLRHFETVCRRAADGTSGDDESHRRVEEEERPVGRAEDQRPRALQSAAGVLRGAGGVAGVTAAAALPQPGGGPGGADEEQNERAIDGGRRRVQQAATPRCEVFHGIAGPRGRSAGIGEGSAAAEPWCSGDVPDHATTVAGQAGEASPIGRAGEAAAEHSGSGRGHGVDVGAGGGRAAALSLDREGGQLLRVYFGSGQFGGQRAPRADFQTAQRALADGTGGSGQVGAAVELATGGGW